MIAPQPLKKRRIEARRKKSGWAARLGAWVGGIIDRGKALEIQQVIAATGGIGTQQPVCVVQFNIQPY